jgi:hypothetical protein
MIGQVRWLRVVIAAFLVEVGLAVLGLPLLAVVSEAVVFNVVVPILCIIVPFVVVWLATRKLPAARFLHGWLIGIVATLMYFGLVIGTSSIAEAAAAYGGMAMFAGVNALRIVSAAAGGYFADWRAVPSAA